MNEEKDMEAPGRGPEVFSLAGARPFLFLCSAVLLLYGRTLFFDLTWFDDNRLVSGNAAVLADPANLLKLFTSDVFLSGQSQFYRPLLNVSFMLDTLLKGPPFVVFHFTSLACHTAAACLFFLLLLRLGRGRGLAFALALVFACHPALTQAVAWLPGRNDSLLCVFALLAFLGLIKTLEGRSRFPFAGYFLAFAAAIFTKETAVAIPLLGAYYMARLSGARPGRGAWGLFGAGSLLIFLAWLAARGAAFRPDRILLAGTLAHFPGLLVMLRQTLFPFFPEVWPVLGKTGLAGGAAAAVLLPAAVHLSGAWRREPLRFGLLWYFLFSVPTLVDIGGPQDTYVWAHRLYLPLAGFLLAVSELKWLREADLSRLRPAAAAGALTVLLAAVSFSHSRFFANRFVFWERVAEEAPYDADIRLYLGYYYQTAGLLGAAEKNYRAALELDPAKPFAHSNLASVYAARGELKPAERELLEELRVSPGAKQAAASLAELRKVLRTLPRTVPPPGRRPTP